MNQPPESEDPASVESEHLPPVEAGVETAPLGGEAAAAPAEFEYAALAEDEYAAPEGEPYPSADFVYATPDGEPYPVDGPAYAAPPGTETVPSPEFEYAALAEGEYAASSDFAYQSIAGSEGAQTPAPAADSDEARYAPEAQSGKAPLLEAATEVPAEPANTAPPAGPDAQVALLCEGLERFLGEAEARVHVLRGVSLRLEPGYVHAVVGPSGCGKSSLLYILGLLDRPDAGRLVISGRAVAALPDDELSRQRNALLGFIFQFHFLLQDFTALENIMIPMRQLGVLSESQMRARAADLLESVGLGGKGQRPSRHLSGGEQQRVAIARALANNPQVILADEPTGNLDTANSTRVFSLLTDLVHRENKALLLVTHNPGIAEACDWVHTMRDGLIVDQRFVGVRGEGQRGPSEQAA